MRKRILITGGFGYFGSSLAKRLIWDHEVILAGRLASSGAVVIPARTLYFRAVRELAAEHAAEADAIVHLAGGGAPGGQSSDAAAALRDNVESAAHIASIAPPGCRLILASTIYTYGTGSRPFVESDTLRPDTLYGQLKAVAEAVWRQRGGTSLRFAHIYGVGSGVDFGRTGVTEKLARAAVGGSPFEMHGDGSQRIDLVHIDDACSAVEAALVAPELPPAVNVGGGAVAVADLVRAFGVDIAALHCQSCGDAMEYIHLEGSNADRRGCMQCRRCGARSAGTYLDQSRAMDISLAKQALGWVPKVALADGAKGLIEMMRGAR